MSKKVINSLTVAVGAALLGSVAVANAGDLFRVNDLGFGYQIAGEEAAEGKCGEGKCGDKKAEVACGGDKSKSEDKGGVFRIKGSWAVPRDGTEMWPKSGHLASPMATLSLRAVP